MCAVKTHKSIALESRTRKKANLLITLVQIVATFVIKRKRNETSCYNIRRFLLTKKRKILYWQYQHQNHQAAYVKPIF